jgi:hypothetical protein
MNVDAKVSLAMRQRGLISGLLAAAILLGVPSLACAALGGDVASVLRDHLAASTTPVITSTASYDLYASQGRNGQTLREYVDHAGHVFAVAFDGPHAPGLGSLLGRYAPRYVTAAKAMGPAHHVVVVNAPDLQITVLRLPRGWKGHAILPGAIPAGVDRREIR